MTTWQEFEAEVPAFAAAVKAILMAGPHHVMATIRADGSPRLSGTEVRFGAQELLIGGMTGNWRFKDLRRDPRLALHNGSGGGPGWAADAKLSGTAIELVSDEAKAQVPEVPPGDFELFAVHLTEVTHIHLEGDPPDQLVIETWKPGQPIQRAVR